MKRVTIYDVAKEAGVSLATVSRVINGSDVVKTPTKERVQAAVDKLGYKPNQEHIEYALNGFETLINRITVNDINENNLNEWISGAEIDDPIYCGFPKCRKHNVILSHFGCKLCNDGA